MKKHIGNCITALLVLSIFAFGVDFAMGKMEEMDKAHFEAEISRLESKAKTQAMLSTTDSQILFYGLGQKLIISPIGIEVSENLVGTKALGSVEYNRLSLSFADGSSVTTYIVDNVGDSMEQRFIVYIQ